MAQTFHSNPIRTFGYANLHRTSPPYMSRSIVIVFQQELEEEQEEEEEKEEPTTRTLFSQKSNRNSQIFALFLPGTLDTTA